MKKTTATRDGGSSIVRSGAAALIVFLSLWIAVPGHAGQAPVDGTVRVKLLRLTFPITIEGNSLQITDLDRSGIENVALPHGETVILDRKTIGGESVWLLKKGDKIVRSSKPFIEIQSLSTRIRVSGYEIPAPAIISPRGARGSADIVAALKLDDYLEGVLAGEMPATWPLEALKAQVVAARTYTLFQMESRPKEPYQLEGSVLDQVYSMALPHSQKEKIQRAIQETQGMVLVENKKVIKAFYHSDCGGQTEDPAVVWGSEATTQGNPQIAEGAEQMKTKQGPTNPTLATVKTSQSKENQENASTNPKTPSGATGSSEATQVSAPGNPKITSGTTGSSKANQESAPINPKIPSGATGSSEATQVSASGNPKITSGTTGSSKANQERVPSNPKIPSGATGSSKAIQRSAPGNLPIAGNTEQIRTKPGPIMDSHCAFTPNGKWNLEISLADLQSKLVASGEKMGLPLKAVKVASRTPSQRAALLAFNDGTRDVFVTGNNLRRILGYQKLKSTLFSIIQKDDSILFYGRGFGHGSGLCQWGARFMAENGSKVTEILRHYYPLARLSEVHVTDR